MTANSTDAPSTSRWRGPLLLIAKLAAVVVGIYLLIGVLRRFDWGTVAEALQRLVWWEVVLILLLVCVRQTVNACTLPIMIPGVTLPQALVTSLSGTLIQTFSPPPADTVLRLSILKSYGVDGTRAGAALVLDTVVFYLARFTAPLVGLALSLVILLTDATHVSMAVLGAVLAGLLVWAMSVIGRGGDAAGKFAFKVGSVAARVRHSIDPHAWAAAIVRFHRESSEGLAARLARATPVMLGFVLADALVLLLCLRFTGIPSHHIGYLAVIAAMFSLYPLTTLPFAGFGVLDAALIALLDSEGAVEPTDMVAALVLWRVVTLVFPLLPGLATLLGWRGRQQKRTAA